MVKHLFSLPYALDENIVTALQSYRGEGQQTGSELGDTATVPWSVAGETKMTKEE